jgi:hypothetical protein
MEKRLNQIKLEYKTGKKLLKDNELSEKQNYSKSISNREEEIERAKNLLIRLKEWIKKQEKIFDLAISKKMPIEDHFDLFIKNLLKELKEREPIYVLKPPEPVKKSVPKLNKYGNSSKKK